MREIARVVAIVAVLTTLAPVQADDPPDGAAELREMMVLIRDSYTRLQERRQWRERVDAVKESMQTTCHPAIVGGARDSSLRRWTGCLGAADE